MYNHRLYTEMTGPNLTVLNTFSGQIFPINGISSRHIRVSTQEIYKNFDVNLIGFKSYLSGVKSITIWKENNYLKRQVKA